MKVSTENDNNFGYEKNMIVVDNMPLILYRKYIIKNNNRQLLLHQPNFDTLVKQ
jgi:hypothetical protein